MRFYAGGVTTSLEIAQLKIHINYGKVSSLERMNIFSIQTIDITVDSFHSYEPCIFKTIAAELFQELHPESEYYSDCEKILLTLDKFKAIPIDTVPRDSLLREFIG